MSHTRWKTTLAVILMLFIISSCEEEDPIDDMTFIKGGTFTMGDVWGDDLFSSEQPTHEVNLSSFYMGKYVVTQGEFTSVVGERNWKDLYGVGVDNPAYFVSWYDVIVYCNILSIKKGLIPVYSINSSTNPSDWGSIPIKEDSTWDAVECNWNANGYRLPTEAEWEYSAGGGSSNRTKWSGTNSESSLGAYAWYDSTSGGKTHPVGTKQPNSLGLYDMSGNVWEWCWDWYGDYNSSSQTNPAGPSSGSRRVLRGGSWHYNTSNCRVARRSSYYPSYCFIDGGFRLVRNAE